MTQTPLRWPGTVGLGDEPAVETQVVDMPTEQRTTKPQPKGKAAPAAKPARVIPAQFSIAHDLTLDMLTVSLVIGGAIAQGILAKLDAQGVPATQAYWIAIALLLPGMFAVASKTGNQKMWFVLCRVAIALAVSPGAAQGLHLVFGN